MRHRIGQLGADSVALCDFDLITERLLHALQVLGRSTFDFY